jgi:hypothetical protein
MRVFLAWDCNMVVALIKVVDLEGKGMYVDKHYALIAVLVILPARWAGVALQPLVFLSVRQV